MATPRPPPPQTTPSPSVEPTLRSIEAAVELVESKKEALKQAFEEFQSHSANVLSPSISISWNDVESHFSSVHSTILLKLDSVRRQHDQRKKERELEQETDEMPSCAAAELDFSRMTARRELRVLCRRMDGEGLIRYLIGHVKEREDIWDELTVALACARNVEELVLSAVSGFHREYRSERGKMSAQRSCVMVLDVFMHMTKERERQGESISAIVSDEGRGRARSLAANWKGIFKGKDVSGKLWAEVLAWLFLVGSFRLLGEHDIEEILDYCTLASHYTRSCEMCRVLDLEDRVPDIIQRLLKKRKQLLAVKLVINFGLQEKFPPGPLIKAHVDDAMKLTQKSQDGGNDSRKTQKEATVRELLALKSAIKVIKEHRLESEYPIMDLEAHIQLLEKPSGESRPIKPHSQPSKQNQNEKHGGKRKVLGRGKEQLQGRKRPRGEASSGHVSIPKMKISGTIPPVPIFQHSYPPTAVARAHGPPPYSISPPKPYHLVNSAPTASSYPGPSNGVYGIVGAPASYSSDPIPPQPYVYPSEAQTPQYYDRPNPYGGYAYPSHYNHSYYPQ
ncbi:hypothetical protein MLD38_034268 [Melastoma candidum]|uniref:Uncharacterized protein n=1 Tax=Melastoma candidum TaxID=119954 RepID=A0ACB9MA06_9MYRT|nr:hypothetical protein MLD38_034268 [Melastoma candidum]